MNFNKTIVAITGYQLPDNAAEPTELSQFFYVLRERVSSAIESFTAANKRHKSRRHLARLDDRLLKDIGLTRAQAKRESNRPFWD